MILVFFFLTSCDSKGIEKQKDSFEDLNTRLSHIQLFDRNGEIGTVISFNKIGVEVVSPYGYLTKITWDGGYGEEVLFDISQSDLSQARFFKVVDDSDLVKSYFAKAEDIQGHVFFLYSNDSLIENRIHRKLFMAQNLFQQKVLDSTYEINYEYLKSYVCQIFACVEYHQFNNIHDVETITGYRENIELPLWVENSAGEIMMQDITYSKMDYIANDLNQNH